MRLAVLPLSMESHARHQPAAVTANMMMLMLMMKTTRTAIIPAEEGVMLLRHSGFWNGMELLLANQRLI